MSKSEFLGLLLPETTASRLPQAGLQFLERSIFGSMIVSVPSVGLIDEILNNGQDFSLFLLKSVCHNQQRQKTLCPGFARIGEVNNA